MNFTIGTEYVGDDSLIDTAQWKGWGQEVCTLCTPFVIPCHPVHYRPEFNEMSWSVLKELICQTVLFLNYIHDKPWPRHMAGYKVFDWSYSAGHKEKHHDNKGSGAWGEKGKAIKIHTRTMTDVIYTEYSATLWLSHLTKEWTWNQLSTKI